MEVQDPIQVPSLTKSEEIWGTGLPSPFLSREISHLVLLAPGARLLYAGARHPFTAQLVEK